MDWNPEKGSDKRNEKINSLTQCTEIQLEEAYGKYLIIYPYLQKSKPLEEISDEENISIRTLRYWIQKYQELGLRGLVRMERIDKSKVKVELAIQEQVKNILVQQRYFNYFHLPKDTDLV